MIRPICLAILFAVSLSSAGQTFSLIRDINPGAGSSNLCYLTPVDNVLFFGANNAVSGMELWKSDGTAAGTVLLKDINAGAASSSIGYLTRVGHSLFFVANNGINGNELWKSDGTSAGTVMVKDIKAGSSGSNPSALVNMNGTLLFAANNGINGTELWKSDGTAAGTVMIKDINTSGSSNPQFLANVNGTVFFSAGTTGAGVELWKSDGTPEGTTLVKDINAGSLDSSPMGLTALGSTVYFAAAEPTRGTELWKSDGTAAGTMLVKDIWTGQGESFPYSLKEIGGTLYFSADNGTTGIEVWKSDGSPAGTVLVKDVWPGMQSGAAGNFSRMINKLIFTGNDGVSGYKTWQSDGSSSGTKMVANLVEPGAGTMLELAETDTKIFAGIQEAGTGIELWAITYSGILPLQLLSFDGELKRDDVMLKWKTTHEENTEDFAVERSIDGVRYVEVGRVDAMNTSGNHIYDFVDKKVKKPGIERVYYRLRQNDLYGRYTYTQVISFGLKTTTTIRVYPIPAVNILTITNVESGGAREYSIIDNIGRVVRRERLITTTNTTLQLNVAALAAGNYFLKIGDQQPVKFIKK